MSNRKQTWKAAVSAAAIAASAMTSFAATNITSNVTLTEDTDWTEFGTVTLAGNATIDLAGHDLKVGGLDGAGTITTSGNILNNGSLESIVSQQSGSNGGFSSTSVHPDSWTYTGRATASAGWCKSKDTTWSKNLNAKAGSYSVWFWCQDASCSGAVISQAVNVARAGWYRLEFWTAARPGSNKYLNMRVHADVDGISRGYVVCSAASWKKTAIDVMLTNGVHTIAFRSDGAGGNDNPCGLLDNVSLRRISALRLAYAAGATYLCQNIALDGVAPIAEPLALDVDCDWRGLGTVGVAEGATIDLAGHKLWTDGIVKNAECGNWIDNGSFERFVGTPSGDRLNFSAAIHFDAWGWHGDSASVSVMWVLGGNWCSSTLDGSYHLAYWINAANQSASVSQTVNVPETGLYRLSFWVAMRPGNNKYKGLRIHADVDGTSQGYVDCTSTTWFEKIIDLNLTAGEHVLSMRGISNGGGSNPCGGIDKISLVRCEHSGVACVTNSNSSALAELHVNVASGTTLRNNALPIGGNLKLVKEGAGTFVSARVQTYSGGTLVAAGTMQPPDGTGSNDAYSGRSSGRLAQERSRWRRAVCSTFAETTTTATSHLTAVR